MPQTPHVESHFTASDFVRDIVIGMADGLTVPFALAAGLSGADTTTRIIVVAGLAEIAAGSIAMGLGGYLAARNDADHYESELRREEREVEEIPEEEAREVLEVFETYGLTRQEAIPIVDSLRQRPQQWIDFMMRFELGLEKPDPKRAPRSASTIAGAYIVGGLIPLAPYMIVDTAYSALIASVIATLVALGFFGAIKGHYTGMPRLASAFRTMIIGGLAAAAAFGIARLVSAK
jgi:VIT1/CCC1 family predicted Fe2+/Mn2+ transporter